MSRRRWDDRFYAAPPRRSVEGGVVVPKPGDVTDPLAVELVDAAQVEGSPPILARGRTYARAGQVVAVQAGARGFTAQIQGTTAKPYAVRLDRTTISGSDRVAADCNCPYGCDDGWCKHAAALAYVAAFLLDRDPAARLAWAGEAAGVPAAGDPHGTQGPQAAIGAPPIADAGAGIPGSIAGIAVRPASALALDPDDLATLRSQIPARTATALLAQGEALVAHPWSDFTAIAAADSPLDPAIAAGPRT